MSVRESKNKYSNELITFLKVSKNDIMIVNIQNLSLQPFHNFNYRS